MSKFKVGQDVWVKELKQICKIDKIEKPMLFDNYYINGNEYTQAELHETAQTMFEKLGYEVDYIQYYCGRKGNKDIILYTKKPYGEFDDDRKNIILFYLSTKEYRTQGISETMLDIDLELHLAIHQKLIELGWLK